MSTDRQFESIFLPQLDLAVIHNLRIHKRAFITQAIYCTVYAICGRTSFSVLQILVTIQLGTILLNKKYLQIRVLVKFVYQSYLN